MAEPAPPTMPVLGGDAAHTAGTENEIRPRLVAERTASALDDLLAYAQAVMAEAVARVVAEAAARAAAVGAEATARANADTALQNQINAVGGEAAGDISALQTQLNFKANAHNAALTGNSTAETPADGTRGNRIATCQFAGNMEAYLVGLINAKANANNAALTGNSTASTPADGTRGDRIATCQFVGNSEAYLQGQINDIYARLGAAGI